MSEFDENEDGAEGTAGLEPGKVYFMREVDLRTGQRFPYYKIGKVLNEKEVAVRLKEHQTGNPRVIETVTEIESPMVTRLETMLHNTFAQDRIHSGEWFSFASDADLAVAIAKANELNADLLSNAKTVEASQSLSKVVSSGTKKAAGSTEQDIVNLLASYKQADTILKGLAANVANHLKGFSAESDFEKIGKIAMSSGRTSFSSSELKKANPDLYKSYQTKAYFSSRFSLDRGLTGSIVVLDRDQYGVGEDTEALGLLTLQDAHLEYLRLWSLRADLAWQIQNLEAEAKVATEAFDGIEGLTTWKRYESVKFDTIRFKAENPELVESFTVTTPGRESFKVFEWKSY